jgi:hypothetical protein
MRQRCARGSITRGLLVAFGMASLLIPDRIWAQARSFSEVFGGVQVEPTVGIGTHQSHEGACTARSVLFGGLGVRTRGPILIGVTADLADSMSEQCFEPRPMLERDGRVVTVAGASYLDMAPRLGALVGAVVDGTRSSTKVPRPRLA